MNYKLTLGWLYPDLMSTYGDRGNIIILQKRCEWRGIKAEIDPITVGANDQQLKNVDFILMGGAEDRQQEIVGKDLETGKDKILHELIEKGIPGLYICGAYQFLGKYYKEADGTIINGLGIFDVYTENPGPNHPRLIGNMVVDSSVIVSEAEQSIPQETASSSIVKVRTLRNDEILLGFENHGGRTYLGKEVKPFAKVIKGFGNNGQDGTEGAIYKNSIGTYLHGPILAKNPGLADYLIQTAINIKYNKYINLDPLDDSLEEEARNVIASRLKLQL